MLLRASPRQQSQSYNLTLRPIQAHSRHASRMIVSGSREGSDSGRMMERHKRALSRKRSIQGLRSPILQMKDATESTAALLPVLQCGHCEIKVLHQAVVPAGQVAWRAQSRKDFQHG